MYVAPSSCTQTKIGTNYILSYTLYIHIPATLTPWTTCGDGTGGGEGGSVGFSIAIINNVILENCYSKKIQF